ncbi:MAG: hypothetical protein JRE65_13575 [Deltaproteobacteria bacterium]|jgi:Sec-independent protein translocase protein TatA|nr:hypothetical protein [Deltaproteobacteria bacterium]
MKIHLLIILVITLLFFSCGSQKLSKVDEGRRKVIAEQKKLIQANINDPEKKTKLLQIIGEIDNESKEFYKYYLEHNNKIAQLNITFETSRQDFEKVIDDFNKRYEIYLRMLIRRRNDMRLLTSNDEWIKIMEREYSFIPE